MAADDLVSLAPTSGVIGAAIEIIGANFGSDQGASTVTFNGTASTPTLWTDTRLVVPVPSGATSGPVVITVGGVATTGDVFTVISQAGLGGNG